MVAKSFIKPQKDGVKKLIIQPKFDIQFADILAYSIEKFGTKVAYDFYTNVLNMITL